MKTWRLRLAAVAALVGGLLVAPVVAQQVVRIYGTVSDGTFLPVLVDTTGRLIVSLSGGTITPTEINLPATTCADPALSETGALTTGIAFTATPSIENCISGTARTTLTASSFTTTVPLLGPDGTAAVPSVSFASDPNSGWYWPSSGRIAYSSDGTNVFRIEESATIVNALVLDVTNQDVSLSRGAANRLDLATGDSFHVVSGGVGIGTAPSSGGLSVLGNTQINWAARAFLTSPSDGVLAVQVNAANAPGSFSLNTPGSATSAHKLIKKVTSIADNTATDVLTVTVPNANHAASISVRFLCSTGSTDAFESSRTADGTVVLARTTGVTTVAAVTALEQAQIATVAAGATLTLAYGASAMTGAAGATQTFTVQVTANDSGNVGGNQCVVLAELVNAEATGVTIQ